jgi:UDP-N-acetylglucosamine--N-acetylmuramyl-(pentapeptide) pyrophosphoryl-undecaprenol N-acetylglucosamine transferase
VCGGSQGAQSINRAVAGVLENAAPGAFQIIWMTGNAGVNEARASLDNSSIDGGVHVFIDDMVTACAAARLIVSRSGASTTAEIAQVGRASILIPYPHATDNHQEKNARAFEDSHAAIVLLDNDCNGVTLGKAISDLLIDTVKLDAMEESARSMAQPVAVERIVEHVFQAAFGDDIEQGQEAGS